MDQFIEDAISSQAGIIGSTFLHQFMLLFGILLMFYIGGRKVPKDLRSFIRVAKVLYARVLSNRSRITEAQNAYAKAINEENDGK